MHSDLRGESPKVDSRFRRKLIRDCRCHQREIQRYRDDSISVTRPEITALVVYLSIKRGISGGSCLYKHLLCRLAKTSGCGAGSSLGQLQVDPQ